MLKQAQLEIEGVVGEEGWRVRLDWGGRSKFPFGTRRSHSETHPSGLSHSGMSPAANALQTPTNQNRRTQ